MPASQNARAADVRFCNGPLRQAAPVDPAGAGYPPEADFGSTVEEQSSPLLLVLDRTRFKESECIAFGMDPLFGSGTDETKLRR